MCDTSRASPAPPLAPPQPPPAELPSREDDASGLRASPRRYKFALPEIHTAISTLSRRSGTFAPTHSEYRPVHRPASDLLHAKPGRLRDVLAAAPQQLPEASSSDLVSLTAPHHNLVRAKIEILYAKAQAFKHAESGPV